MSLNTASQYPPIGYMKTSFKEKFGVPRQSLMIPAALGILKLNPDPQYKDALKTLEEFSHVWIVFVFHQHLDQVWRPMITPPRIDAPGKVGVFASRSPHRPNPIGLSAVKLEKIDWNAPGGIEIHFSGVDLMDETPVLDIKPYLPFVDCIPEAVGGWTETKIPKYEVIFSTESAAFLKDHSDLPLIQQMLALDPRPTSQKKTFRIEDPSNEGKPFAFRIFDFDVKWEIRNFGIYVVRVVTL